MTDTSFILWLQQFANPFWDFFFINITKLGNPEYYMVVIPLYYWCIDKKNAFRFSIFFLLSSFINSGIKGFTDVARPSGDEVRILYHDSTQGSSSFPSGHTQGTAAFWGYLALRLRDKLFTIISIIIIILVGLSRLYLGLHYPIDVIAGLGFAFITLILFSVAYDPLMRKLKVLSAAMKLLLALIVPLLFLWVPGHDTGMIIGFTIGLLIGYQIEEEYLDFSAYTSFEKQCLKFAIGMIGFFSLRVLLKGLFLRIGLSDAFPLLSDILRYGIIGLWTTYFSPLLFVKIGLSQSNRGSIFGAPLTSRRL